MSYVEQIEKIYQLESTATGLTASEFESLFCRREGFEDVVDLASVVRRTHTLRKNLIATDVYRPNPLAPTKMKGKVLVHKKFKLDFDADMAAQFRLEAPPESKTQYKHRKKAERLRLIGIQQVILQQYMKYSSGMSASEFCDLYGDNFPSRGELLEIIRGLKASNHLVGTDTLRTNQIRRQHRPFEVLIHRDLEYRLSDPAYGEVISQLDMSPMEKDFLRDNYLLSRGDALEKMSRLETDSVDLICVDLPYGVSKNKWDAVIPMEPMWKEFHRVGKDTAAIVLTATQPFASQLITSNLKNFRYDLIWHKTICSGQLNVNKMPLRAHEQILVFYKKLPTYNEQKTVGDPYEIKRKAKYKADNIYNEQKAHSKTNDGFRHAQSVLTISNPRIKGGHPTQKPLELMEYIIKTYSNESDVVLDCCMGSGTTGEAAANLGRKFIGIELDETYFYGAWARVEAAYERNQSQNNHIGEVCFESNNDNGRCDTTELAGTTGTDD